MAHRIELRARADQHFTYGGRSLLVTALDGRVGDRGLEGFYADETRLLCRFDLSADGVPLAPVAASPVGGPRFLAYAEIQNSRVSRRQPSTPLWRTPSMRGCGRRSSSRATTSALHASASCGREFLMKDAYSFDADLEQLNASYDAMYEAYCRIFDRCGLPYVAVEAESGPIGGDSSHEFMVPSTNGEDVVIQCPACGYAANLERAEIGAQPPAAGRPADGRRPTRPSRRPTAGRSRRSATSSRSRADATGQAPDLPGRRPARSPS